MDLGAGLRGRQPRGVGRCGHRGVAIVGVGLLDPGGRGAWTLAFGILAVGPLVGIVAMLFLRRRPEAVLMAGGRR